MGSRMRGSVCGVVVELNSKGSWDARVVSEKEVRRAEIANGS